MRPTPVEQLAGRVAAASPRHFARAMAWAAIYLARAASAPAGWVVSFRDGGVDRAQPVVYWAGTRRRATGAPDPQPIGGLPPEALGLDPDAGELVLLGEGDSPPQLPLAGWMESGGYVARMLLLCRHEGELVAAIGFLTRSGGPGFTSPAAAATGLFGPVVGHALSVAREAEQLREGPVEGGVGLLSSRETEVATLSARGATNAEVAAALGVSPGTVKSHLHRVYAKLGLDSKTELVLLFDSIPRDIAAPGDQPGS